MKGTRPLNNEIRRVSALEDAVEAQGFASM